jgi:hypothetical protein
MILTWEDTYCPSYGQYVSSQVKIIELPRWWTVRAFSCQNHRAPQMMDSTCLLKSKSYSSPEFDMRRHVLSIIWGALWFWHEKARTAHQLGRSTILTWEDTYCPSSGELYDFDLRRHVMSIIWVAIWSCLLMSKSDSSPDDGQNVPSTVKIIELPKWSTVRTFSGQNDRAP